METKNSLENGMRLYLLNEEEVDYMYNLATSNELEKMKASILYNFCNFSTLNRNIEKNRLLDESDIKKLEVIKKLYTNFDLKGLLPFSKNRYKCDTAEMEMRILKIKEVFKIIESNLSDYNKAFQLLFLFDDSNDLRRSYTYIVNYGESDNRLDVVRYELSNFYKVLKTFVEYENSGIIDNVRYVKNNLDKFQYNDFAHEVINTYIAKEDAYKEKEFLGELNINKDEFNFCVSTIEELDVDLYNIYKEKKEQMNKVRFYSNKATIENLAIGIETGMLPDGTPFTLFEFLKRIPFKGSYKMVSELHDFMRRNNKAQFKIINNYMAENKLYSPNAFKPLNVEEIYAIKNEINGVEFTSEDKDVIIDYLKVNNIPLINKAYYVAKKMYLNGEITKEMVEEQKVQKELERENKLLLKK